MAVIAGGGYLSEEVVRLPLGWGGEGRVLLGLLPNFLIFCVCGYDVLVPFHVITDYETRVGQGHAALCPRVIAE